MFADNILETKGVLSLRKLRIRKEKEKGKG